MNSFVFQNKLKEVMDLFRLTGSQKIVTIIYNFLQKVNKTLGGHYFRIFWL